LRPVTKHLGLSLGDRGCLALAILKNATAVTADKSWANLNCCKIEVIR
jgi:PIN domain nuclease of toxin-antitoxin system